MSSNKKENAFRKLNSFAFHCVTLDNRVNIDFEQ